ncbi:MAG: 23S rRNA (adenine(2503)-C(2))-methyltransferase RlmN [Spirochaetales bacterium]|nr:23S rRNA (adenine(2503)-C(2))-methyltransferase RlmN [Spirochaetales bacterium]
MNLPRSLYGLTSERLVESLDLPEKRHGGQIINWLGKGATTFDEMTDLPLDERRRLADLVGAPVSSKATAREEDGSGTIKLGITLHDGRMVEAVLLVDRKGRHTACLSVQVGCAMGCTFCKTGTMGLIRNLASEEIIEQYVHLSKVATQPITHIVFMGMGEPLNNFDPTIRAIHYLNQKETFNIGLRRMTISTCGVVPGIDKLAELKLPIRLAVSLVSADDSLRTRLMPVNRRWPLDELKEALLSYQEAIPKRFTLEYCMLGGVNTTGESARQLELFTRGLDVVVNLIAWNPIDGLEFTTPSEEEQKTFSSLLNRYRVKHTLRISRGRAIGGACGQLATSHDL